MLLLVFDAAGDEDEVLPGVRGNHLEHYVYGLREVLPGVQRPNSRVRRHLFDKIFLLKTLIINKKFVPHINI